MSALSTPLLVAVFVASAGVIWVAGIRLSNATDAFDARLGLGSALGGLIILSIATDLPEAAITVSAATSGHLDLAVGNLLGGIAAQTLVLAAFDARLGSSTTLTSAAGSLLLVIEGLVVIAVTVAAIMTAQLPASTNLGGLSPGTAAVVVLWLGGLFVVARSRRALSRKAEDAPSERRALPWQGRSLGLVLAAFAAAALFTLVAGVAIEESGSELATRLGLGGAIFGATILAFATALPELSTGIAAVRLGDNELAISDIFGGNAFLPVLFVVADLVSGTPALPSAQKTDVWIAGLGVLLTAIYVVGLVTRPQRTHARLGIDSLVALGVYVLGVIGLTLIG